LLTGHPPFQAASLPALVKAVREQAPAFPDDVHNETNPEFRDMVLKMLAKDPGDRFVFPSQLMERLDEIGKQYDVDADVLFNR
jgi:serine/threonine protein kinase